MPNTVRFLVSRRDVYLLLAELRDHLPKPNTLYAALLEQLLGAAAFLDTGSADKTDLELPEKDAQAFREWLKRAEIREIAGDPAKSNAFARLRACERMTAAMGPDVYEGAAAAIRQFRTALDRYAAELSETEAALRQMRDDPPADREARHRRAVQRVIDLTVATERELAGARETLEELGKEGA
jgi:hypothetical protein